MVTMVACSSLGCLKNTAPEAIFLARRIAFAFWAIEQLASNR